MGAERSRIVNILLWGGFCLVLAGGCLSFASSSGRPFDSGIVTVVITPTPQPVAPTAARGSEAIPTATVEPPLVITFVAYSPPGSTDAVISYTLPITYTPPDVGVVPLRIRIPAIGLEAPITPIGQTEVKVEGVLQPIWDVPNWRAAGWHETSAKIGAAGNTVLNGHNTSNGEVFRDLYKLEVGAEIFIEAADGMTYTYVVTEKLILPEKGQSLEKRLQNAQYILPTADERLTLVTCHPYGSLDNRLLIIAHPAPNPEGD